MTAPLADARVVLVHGKKPTPHSLVWELLEGLRAQGARIQAWQDAPDLSPAVFADADLVMLRSVHPTTAELARSGAPPGAAWCNPPGATKVVADRVETWRRLRAAGLPVPSARVVYEPREVAALVADGPVVVKTPLGSRGEGVTILERGEGLPGGGWGSWVGSGRGSWVDGGRGAWPGGGRGAWPGGGRGPWLVQERVPGDGWDRKLFVVGRYVHGTLRRWPARSLTEKLGRPLHPDAELTALALAAGRVFGLCDYGVDVIDGPDGPVIVDVNAFPGFKGVPAALDLLFDHLLRHLDRRQLELRQLELRQRDLRHLGLRPLDRKQPDQKHLDRRQPDRRHLDAPGVPG